MNGQSTPFTPLFRSYYSFIFIVYLSITLPIHHYPRTIVFFPTCRLRLSSTLAIIFAIPISIFELIKALLIFYKETLHIFYITYLPIILWPSITTFSPPSQILVWWCFFGEGNNLHSFSESVPISHRFNY